MNNSAIQNISINKQDFFKLWLTLIKPYLKLRNKESEVLSKLLEYRYNISLKVKGDENIDFILFSKKIKDEIETDLNISEYVLNNIISSLRKKKYIINKSINKKIIPNVNLENNNFKLIYNVNIK